MSPSSKIAVSPSAATACSNDRPSLRPLQIRSRYRRNGRGLGDVCQCSLLQRVLSPSAAPANVALRPDAARGCAAEMVPSITASTVSDLLLELRDAEIEDLDGVAAALVWFEPDVVGLQIAVNDPLLDAPHGPPSKPVRGYRASTRRAGSFPLRVSRRACSRRDTPSPDKRPDPRGDSAKPKSVTLTTFG